MRSLLLLSILCATSVQAGEEADPKPTPSPEVDLEKAVRDLGDPEWTIRESASNTLSEAGDEAIPHLASALESGDEEIITRSTEILKQRILPRFNHHGWIGIQFSPSPPNGYVIVHVLPNHPAEDAGLLAGDILLSLDGKSLAAASQDPSSKIFVERIQAKKPGDVAAIELQRKGKKKKIEFQIGRRPESELSAEQLKKIEKSFDDWIVEIRRDGVDAVGVPKDPFKKEDEKKEETQQESRG